MSHSIPELADAVAHCDVATQRAVDTLANELVAFERERGVLQARVYVDRATGETHEPGDLQSVRQSIADTRKRLRELLGAKHARIVFAALEDYLRRVAQEAHSAADDAGKAVTPTTTTTTTTPCLTYGCELVSH